MKQRFYTWVICACLGLTACQSRIEVAHTLSCPPPLCPDYTEITLPPNIAPLHFCLPDSCRATELQAHFTAGAEEWEATGNHGEVSLPAKKWRRLLQGASTVTVRLLARIDDEWTAYAPFSLHVATEQVDSHLAYRLIEPGYETWNEMGIYQRCLENYEEKAILTNRQTGYGCMNCHSFCKQDPNQMLFHLRLDYGGTYLIDHGNIEKLNTKTPQTLSALVYPSWHPSGRYVAFSVNSTKQMFHTTDRNRIEVMDFASDVVVYDVEQHTILKSSLLSTPEAFETFPTFSPDGRTLYFCSADSVSMPGNYDRVHYSLCSIGFDPDSRSFANRIDTLYNVRREGGSVSFPRVSPDGRFLMFTRSHYGNFSIWHREADLYLADLTDGSIRPLDSLNSHEVESYHSWSSNGRWVVFSSRRMDGLYTRPYIAYIDEEGNTGKPFVLPQERSDYYTMLMKSYNIPEFITGPVTVEGHAITQIAKQSPGIDLTCIEK